MSTEKTNTASSFKVTKKGIEELVELLKDESALQWKIGDWLNTKIPVGTDKQGQLFEEIAILTDRSAKALSSYRNMSATFSNDFRKLTSYSAFKELKSFASKNNGNLSIVLDWLKDNKNCTRVQAAEHARSKGIEHGSTSQFGKGKNQKAKAKADAVPTAEKAAEVPKKSHVEILEIIAADIEKDPAKFLKDSNRINKVLEKIENALTFVPTGNNKELVKN